MQRRTFLAASAASLALPGYARAQSQTTLKFIPQIALSFLDPHWTTAYVTRNHGYLVFDTLYGIDANYKPTPQMVSGHTVETDGKLWKLTLRDGLFWHDGTPVLARDCVASIRRWSKRDSMGEALMQATDELSAPDDKTVQFRLKKPFPLLPDTLGKAASPMPAMMPERIANTDPFTQITDIIGSGPYRYVSAERVQGARDVYAKFEKYAPRNDGPAEWTSGPKLVHFDRVEWNNMPDASTASGALQNGEQDWWETPVVDLLPLLRRNANIRVSLQDSTGNDTMMRPNHTQPPFNNPAVRRALFYALNQVDYMESVVGQDTSLYYTTLGAFCPKTPMANEAGLDPLRGKRDIARVKEMLKNAGYAGEKTVVMVPVDYVTLKALGEVAADMMQKCGMNVDFQAIDWGTMLQRRNKKDPVDKGGWSVFITSWAGLDHLNPAGHIALRGNGDSASAWPGWCVSPQLEAQRQSWFDAPDLTAQQKICADMQVQAMQDVPYYPLGQFFQPTAYRTTVVDMNSGFPTFWNIRKTG